MKPIDNYVLDVQPKPICKPMTAVSIDLIDEIESYVRRGAGDVFRTMLNMEAKAVEEPPSVAGNSSMVVGSVGFAGKASGVIFIAVPESLANEAASAMVGLSPSELDPDMVNDVIAELSNMIVGYVKSQLCDTGHTCVLTVPSVMRGDHMKVQRVSLARNKSSLMICNKHVVTIEIVLKSDV